MELLDKLTILADAAKYDAACTSSGLDRAGRPGQLGSTTLAGCCHSFSADGRCVTLLKVLHLIWLLKTLKSLNCQQKWLKMKFTVL